MRDTFSNHTQTQIHGWLIFLSQHFSIYVFIFVCSSFCSCKQDSELITHTHTLSNATWVRWHKQHTPFHTYPGRRGDVNQLHLCITNHPHLTLLCMVRGAKIFIWIYDAGFLRTCSESSRTKGWSARERMRGSRTAFLQRNGWVPILLFDESMGIEFWQASETLSRVVFRTYITFSSNSLEYHDLNIILLEIFGILQNSDEIRENVNELF